MALIFWGLELTPHCKSSAGTGADDWGVGHDVEAALRVSTSSNFGSLAAPCNATEDLGERILRLLSLPGWVRDTNMSVSLLPGCIDSCTWRHASLAPHSRSRRGCEVRGAQTCELYQRCDGSSWCAQHPDGSNQV